MLRPDHLTITVVDGEVGELKVSGPLVLKSGQPSASVREDKSWSPDNVAFNHDRVSTAPSWVRRLWSEAPAGVTSWNDPEQPE